MPVGLYDLIHGVSDEVCDDHVIRAVVQQDRHEGVAEIVVSDALDARLLDVGFKGVGEGIFMDGVFSAEKERGFSLIPGKSVSQRRADGGVSDLFVFRRCDLVRGTVHGLAGIGFIEQNGIRFDVGGGERKDLSLSSSCEEGHGEHHSVTCVIDHLYELVELLAAPESHFGLLDARLRLLDELQIIGVAMSRLCPR